MAQGRGGYRESASLVVYGCDTTANYTRADWVGLALAALDQAGIFPDRLATAYQHARGDTDGTLDNLDLL